MSRLPIIMVPNDSLLEPSLPISESEIASPEFQAFLDHLLETMDAAHGVGVAAPQVGVHKRVYIGRLHGLPQAFINPAIVARSFRKVDSEEGCLSIPGVWGIVRRHQHITIEYQQRDGSAAKEKLSGLEAIIAQHESDHLDGILFTSLVKKYTTVPNDL